MRSCKDLGIVCRVRLLTMLLPLSERGYFVMLALPVALLPLVITYLAVFHFDS